MFNIFMISRAARVGERGPATGSIAKWTWPAMLSVLLGGCVTAPTQPDPTTVSPTSTTSQESSGTATADPASRPGSRTDFHKTATERQRFQVHVDFGRVFETQGNFQAAVLEYQSALAVAEARVRGQLTSVDEALAHRRMGGALDQLGRFAQAEVHYKKALKLSPKDPRIWNDAGYSFYLQGRWAEAEGALKTAAKMAPDDERIRTNLGLTLAAAGRTDEALPLLSRTSGDAVGHMNLGYLLAATGQLDLARQQYETALALRPDLGLAHRAIAQLDRQRGITPASGAETMVARSTRTTRAAVVDPGVNQASTSPVRTIAARTSQSPPMPARTLPQSKPPAPPNPPSSEPSASKSLWPELPSQEFFPLPPLPNP